MNNRTITKREIIASITILAILFTIGIFISNNLEEKHMDDNAKYNQAVKINNSNLFKYGMETSVGNAFVYGKLEAIDTVRYQEVKGEYLYIRQETERYTSHTRIVSHRVGKRTYHTTETYWTWDNINIEEKKSDKVKFCNVEFNTSQFEIPSAKYIDTVSAGFHLRNVYYGFKANSKGTIFAKLSNKNIPKSGVKFYQDKNIKQTVKSLESSSGLILFWIGWSILIIFIIGIFYWIDNNWLE